MIVFVDDRFEDHDLTMWDHTDEIHKVSRYSTLADLVVILGKFQSKTQARKNGFSGPIPFGITDYKVGKTYFCTHMASDDWLPYDQWLVIDKQEHPEDYNERP